MQMTAESTEGRPVAVWMQTLEAIEEALVQRLAATPEPPAPAGEPGPDDNAALLALDERLALLQARLEQAALDAAEADDVLRAEAEAHQRWTESMTAARRGLADWAAGVK
jgi:hypothetical protein